MTGPGDKSMEDIAEDILNEADQDLSTDDLTRGTEIYEEEDMDYDEGRDDELDLDPGSYRSNGGMGLFDGDYED